MKLHQKLFLLLVLLLPVQLGRHFWPEWSYVMGLRVDYLSPTIYLTDILVFLILGTWILDKFKIQNPCLAGRQAKSKIKIKNSKFIFFLASVFIFLLANCFFAKNQGVAVYRLVKIAEFSLLGFYVAKNDYSLFTIHWSLVLAVIYSSLLAIAQFIKQSSVGGIFWWLGERTFNAGTPGIAKTDFFGHLLLRPYATFPHPNVLAAFVLIAFILSAPFVYQKDKLLFVFYFLISTVTLFISFSQAVWLVGLVVGLLVLGNLKINKWLKGLAWGGAIFLLIFYLIKVPIFMEESFSQRLGLAKNALQLIKQNLFIGVGLNNFIVNLPKFQQGQILWLQPVHNIYLLMVAETGLVGLVIFGWFLFLSYKKLLSCYARYLVISNKKRDIEISRYQNSLFIALGAILALGLFDHYWLTLQQTQLLFAIILGLIWGEEKG